MTRSLTTGQARTLAGIGAFAAAIAIAAPAVAALGDDSAPHIRAVSTAPTPDIEKNLGPHTAAMPVAGVPAPTQTVGVATSDDAPPDVSVDAPKGGGSNTSVDTTGSPDVAVSSNSSSTQHAGPSNISTTATGSSSAPNGKTSTSSSQVSQSSSAEKGTSVAPPVARDDLFGPSAPSISLPQMPNVPGGGPGR
jgi:hypothetical protein